MVEVFLAMQEVQGSSPEQLNYIISSVFKQDIKMDNTCMETIEIQNKCEV